MGKTVNIVLLNETELNCHSSAQILSIPARGDAPEGFEVTDASDFAALDGMIEGVDTSMEYRKAGSNTWTRVYSTYLTDLSVGEYHVRYYATNDEFASEYAIVTVTYDELTFVDKDSYDIPAGQVESEASNNVSAGVSGGQKPYTYSISGPAWISIDNDGNISGLRPSTPQAATTATITVTDAEGSTQTITISIGEVSERPTYTVTFNDGGGSGTMDAVPGIRDEYALPDCAFTAPVGYVFLHWNVNGYSKNPGDVITVTDNIMISAVWKRKTVTITFNTNGGNDVAAITAEYGTAVVAPADPVKEGYTFAGWNEPVPATMPAENVTFTATWTINQYTVTFDTDGGSTIDPITQDYGTAIVPPADPTKDGYTFAGWDTAIPATMPAENVTITATWTLIPVHEHADTDGQWESDGTYHWHVCSCTEQFDKAAHEDGDGNGVCDICAYTLSASETETETEAGSETEIESSDETSYETSYETEVEGTVTETVSKPESDTDTDAADTEAPTADEGCASVVGLGAMAILTAVAAAVVLKKKD